MEIVYGYVVRTDADPRGLLGVLEEYAEKRGLTVSVTAGESGIRAEYRGSGCRLEFQAARAGDYVEISVTGKGLCGSRPTDLLERVKNYLESPGGGDPV